MSKGPSHSVTPVQRGQGTWQQFVAIICVFELKMYQNRFQPVICPDPAGRSLRCFPRAPNRLEGGHSSPLRSIFDTFGISRGGPKGVKTVLTLGRWKWGVNVDEHGFFWCQVNGHVLYGRSHLNASAIIKSVTTRRLRILLLRYFLVLFWLHATHLTTQLQTAVRHTSQTDL